MQDAILETFLEALRQIFKETGIRIEEVGPLGNDSHVDQVVTSVGITGKLKGNFILCTDYPSARRIVSLMTGGIRIPSPERGLGELQKTALGEMANQISGRAVTLLSERRWECSITPPIIITAESLTSHMTEVTQSFARVVRGGFGTLRLLIAVSSQ